jgi:hypothetical protein
VDRRYSSHNANSGPNRVMAPKASSALTTRDVRLISDVPRLRYHSWVDVS